MRNHLIITIEEAEEGFVVILSNTSKPHIYEHPDSVRNAINEELDKWLDLVEAANDEQATE